MNDMKYKGYLGSVEVDVDDNLLHGKLLFIRDLVTYQSASPSELKGAFQEAVDDYLVDCENQGVEPETPCKGQFNVRVSPKLHRQLAMRSRSLNKTMNEYVGDVLRCHEELGENGSVRSQPETQFLLIPSASDDSGKLISRRSAQVSSIASSLKRGRRSSSSGWVTTGVSNAKH